MKKVLLFARDPGGANVLIPVYRKLEGGYQIEVYGKDFAVKRMQEAGLAVLDIAGICQPDNYNAVKDFLADRNPDIILTGTSLDDFTERYLWKAAGFLGIKSFAVMDQWMNLGIRFSDCNYKQEKRYWNNPRHPYLPDRICVMDELAKELMIQEGIEEKRIVVTGQPHFDCVRERYQNSKKISDSNFFHVVFASEPILKDYDAGREDSCYWGYNEHKIFRELYDCLLEMVNKHHKKIHLIIRPHPREPQENWDTCMKELVCDDIYLECNRGDDSFTLLKSADFICGMSSMFLLEAAICEKPVASILIGLKRENPFVLDKIGCCKSILTKAELLQRLDEMVHQETIPIDFKFIENASQHVITCIEEEI